MTSVIRDERVKFCNGYCIIGCNNICNQQFNYLLMMERERRERKGEEKHAKLNPMPSSSVMRKNINFS